MNKFPLLLALFVLCLVSVGSPQILTDVVIRAATCLVAYDATRRLTRSDFTAYFLGFCVIAIGASSLAFLNNYCCLWLAAYLLGSQEHHFKTRAVVVGVLHGLLMAAQHDFQLITIFWAFAIVQLVASRPRKRGVPNWFRGLLLVTISSSLVQWITRWLMPPSQALPWIGQTFENIALAGGLREFLLGLPLAMLHATNALIIDAFGSLWVLPLYLSLGVLLVQGRDLGRFALTYFIVAVPLLYFSWSANPDLGGNLSPVLFLGLALFFEHLRVRTPPIRFWGIFSLGSLAWIILSKSELMSRTF